VGVSVNVSVKQFEIGDLVGAVHGALRAAELDARLLTVEITESVMLQHTERNTNTLRALRQLGVQIALDDFGTGYSSLTHLRRLPLDSLKIDRSFLQALETDERDVAMLRAIVDLGATYGVAVVAEGIDTQAKLEAVRRLGCRFGQGFLFSRPAPIGDVAMHLTVERAFTG
jgi:EAL domain-containing protein (putative c-di-GMP-specific phosphodiesterase class I)